MTTRLEQINKERELLNYEYTHLYNMVRHNSKGTLYPRRKLINRDQTLDQAEYGLIIDNDGKKKIWKFDTLERCQQEQGNYDGSMVVRLGRDSKSSIFDILFIDDASQIPDTRFLAHSDESGNIEAPEVPDFIYTDINLYQLISNDLSQMGFIHQSGCRPSSILLRDLAMRYNDIVPEDFAAAVVKHCELFKTSEKEHLRGKTAFVPSEEKAAWFDTPAGQAWVKEYPTPNIFNVPTPDILKHRRG